MNSIKFHNFEEAGKRVLKYLHEHFGFGLWMITRVENDNWIILQSENEKYDIQQGQVFRWSDSYCYHMVQGKTPKIAPCSNNIEVYANASINQHLEIQSYIGEPLLNEDGSVFGSICGIDTEVKSDDLIKDAPILELLGSLLSTILQSELRENQQRRLRERFEVEALTDGLTGLYNRRAWDSLLKLEEERCQRYGLPATIFSLDLNDLKLINDQFGHDRGDQLIQNTAELLKMNMRANDVIARLGGDEFVILCPEMSCCAADALSERLVMKFAEADIHVAIGYASRQLNTTLDAVLIEADKNMYAHKKRVKDQQL
ncbi:sensor domain-containing diguanylate cyclase [Acinetobacter sp. 187]|uniref:sensor domain-containing diguanylate cyclase n=1 Tax=Acinetobacter lanii TaxID=2715163 RepID=UPI00140832F7|nr:sensor domain-containing diguanylate cyclase [Acinetobacter lanii]NHC04222.1 sensor domain-containing diguanylate cyclase [Acinetobacter lanii]